MLVIEFMKDNFEHLDCNAGILAQILSHAEQEPIHIFCGDSHFKNLKQKLDNYQINTSKLVHHKIIPIGKIIRDYSHFTHQLKIIKNIKIPVCMIHLFLFSILSLYSFIF